MVAADARLQPPALEDVQVKPEIKPESVDDCMVDSESSPTLELDIWKAQLGE